MAIRLDNTQKDIALHFFTSIITVGTGENLGSNDEFLKTQNDPRGCAGTPARIRCCELASGIILNNLFRNVDATVQGLIGAGVADSNTYWKEAYADDLKELCQGLAYGCYEYELYWDDLSADPQEIEDFENTEFGKAIKEFGCYESARARREAGLGVDADPTIAQKISKFRSYYKNSGDKLPDIRDAMSGLINPPPAGYMFRLIGDRFDPTQNTKPSVYIRPITTEKRAWTCEVNGTNKVFIGSAKGFAYFELYFTTLQAAQAMLIALNNAGRIPAKVQNLRAYRKRAEIKTHNAGFVQVGTEFGTAYIIAKKANNESIEPVYDEDEVLEEENVANEPNMFENMSGKEFNEFARDFHKYS